MELADAVATITLDRPPVNAVNLEVIDDYLAAVAGLADDAAVRAVVITGIDGRFCAGADIAMMGDTARANHERVRRRGRARAGLRFPLAGRVRRDRVPGNRARNLPRGRGHAAPHPVARPRQC